MSPNADARPASAAIELVVIHNISLPPGRFGGDAVVKLFTNTLDCSLDPSFADLEGLEVSSHLFINRRGKVTQFVPFDQRAWHAGLSSWRGRSGCNNFAIGIELEGADAVRYTESQYKKVTAIVRALIDTYPRLSTGTIVGHNEIAPERKTDPGESFDWARLLQGVAG